MAKTITNTPSYDEVRSRLECTRIEIEELENGHRKTLYGFLQQGAEMAMLVEADEKVKSRFRKEMGDKDVLRGVLIFIFNAKSLAEKKEASKRTLAVRYLIDKLEIAVEDIATEIVERGGIEKLARLAAKSRSSDEDQDDDEDEDQDEPEEEHEDDKPKHKLGKQVIIGLSPKLATKLNQFADKTRVKIIGYVPMSSNESSTIEVKKIVEAPIKKKDAASKVRAVKKSGKSNAKGVSRKKPANDDDDDQGDWEE